MRFGPRVAFAPLLAALTVVPLLFLEPRFAQGPLEIAQLLIAPMVGLAVVALLATGLNRLRRREQGRAGGWSAIVCLGGLLAATGWIVGGWIAALVGAVAFAVPLAVAKRRGSDPTSDLWLWAGATLLSVVLVSGLAIWPSLAPKPERQVVMVGFDGASWPIIDQLREAGDLPTFNRLVEQGTRGELSTLHPVISPPIWTSIATGMTPDNHGIRDFWSSADQVRAKRIWEIADDHGLVSGSLGYLVTWPPRKESGFLVPGWLAQGPETLPPSLSFLKQLEMGEKRGESRTLIETVRLTLAALRHGATLSTLKSAAAVLVSQRLERMNEQDLALHLRLLKLRLSSDVFCRLLRDYRPDLAIYYDSSTDAIQHMFFKYFEPEGFPELTPEDVGNYGQAIPEVYRQADTALKKILRAASPTADLLVVSDHGQRSAMASGETWYAIKSSALIEESGIDSLVRATNVGRSVFLRSKLDENALSEALRRIEEITSAEDGQPLFVADRRSEFEANLRVRPGFELDTNPLVTVGDRQLPAIDVVGESDRISGTHTETALLLMRGPAIEVGKALDEGSIVDVAPTVLYLLGLPLSRELDGEVLVGALTIAFQRQTKTVLVDSYGAPTAERAAEQELDEDTLKKLRALGYLQ
ncbi:MAG: hypothetical protein GY769_13175 [bacterium]|nr:hypothetical protein [bacterium]